MYEPCTAEGSGLSGIDDCAIHLQCWDVDPQTRTGRCVGLCTATIDAPGCADPNAQCIVTGDGVLILCLPGCDPLLDDCAVATEVCVPNPNGEGFLCTPGLSGDEGQHGDPCEYVKVCDPGLFCANPDSVAGCMGATGCCAAFCDLTDPPGNDQCPGVAGGEECVPWWEAGMAPPELEHMGACVIP